MTNVLQYTPLEDIPKFHDVLRAGFQTGKLKSVANRKKQLLGLAHLLKDNLSRFEEAGRVDLGRPPVETTGSDVLGALHEIKVAYSNVAKWAKEECAPLGMTTVFSPVLRKEAKGVVCIISPFNFPLYCAFSPLAGAIAAGNAGVVKLSEQMPATASLVAELMPQYLDPDLYRVINGGVVETTKMLELRWDHIFYTGSGRVGRIVAVAAAKNLTPVSLELGGKNPVVVDTMCNVRLLAGKVLWGRTFNAGQICGAPDYVVVPRSIQDDVVEAFVKQWHEFFPVPGDFSSHSRLVSEAAYERVANLLLHTRGTVVAGGLAMARKDENLIPPTVVRDVPMDDSLMAEEIFAPVLPIVPVDSLDDALAFINARDTPLAVYIFTSDEKFTQKVLDNTQSGGATINEVIVHPGIDGLPFGGVGASGSGYHTGIHGFNTFTHFRAVAEAPKWTDKLMSARYPPYSDKDEKRVASMLPKFPPLK